MRFIVSRLNAFITNRSGGVVFFILTSSETTTDEAIALGIDISKTGNYEEGQLTRFVSLEYKSDLRRDGNDYKIAFSLSKISAEIHSRLIG
jgi:hypothetical protein